MPGMFHVTGFSRFYKRGPQCVKKYIWATVTDTFINKICREHPTEPSLRESVDCQNQRYHAAGGAPLQKRKAKYLSNSFLSIFRRIRPNSELKC